MPRGKPKPTPRDATFLNEGGYRPDLVVQNDIHFTTLASDAWVDKYAPISFDEVCGNDVAKAELIECITNNISVPIVVYGGMGVGKRTAVKLCLETHEFEISEYSLSLCSIKEIRRECDPDENVLLALCNSSKRKAIVCLDATSLSRSEHTELFSMMRQIAKTTLCIIIDTSPHDHCACIHFKDLTREEIGIHLAWLAAEENIPFRESDVPFSSDMRSCVQALQFGDKSSVYVASGHSDEFLVAARAVEAMQANCDDNLEAVVALSDAMSLAERVPIYNRAMATFYAAGTAMLFEFKQAATLSSLARNAQMCRQKTRVNLAWRTWGLSPVMDAPAKDVMRNYLLNDELETMTLAQAHALGTICRSNEPAVNRLIVRKTKLLQTAHDN